MKRMTVSNGMAGLCAGLVLALTGCSSTAFNREWKRAGAQPTPARDISGRWAGAWRSDANQHRGDLRCIVTPLTPEQYRFYYNATFWKIFNGSYTITQQVQRVDHTFKMRGGADLGTIYGGYYTYEGEATPTNFFSTYRSKHDHGVFRMTRPGE